MDGVSGVRSGVDHLLAERHRRTSASEQSARCHGPSLCWLDVDRWLRWGGGVEVQSGFMLRPPLCDRPQLHVSEARTKWLLCELVSVDK